MKIKILIIVMLQLSFINAIAQQNAIKRSSAKKTGFMQLRIIFQAISDKTKVLY